MPLLHMLVVMWFVLCAIHVFDALVFNMELSCLPEVSLLGHGVIPSADLQTGRELSISTVEPTDL